MNKLAETLEGSGYEESIKEAEAKAGEAADRLNQLEEELNKKLEELEKANSPSSIIPEGIDISDVEIPDVDLSDVNIPNIDMGNVDLPEEAKRALEDAKSALEEARNAVARADGGLPQDGAPLLAGVEDALKRAQEGLAREIDNLGDDSEAKEALSKAEEGVKEAQKSIEGARDELIKAADDYAARVKEAEEKAREAAEAAAKEAESAVKDDETIKELTDAIADLRSKIDEYRAELNVYETLIETYKDLKEQAAGQVESPKEQMEKLGKKYGGDISAAFKEYTKLQQDRLVNEALTQEIEAANKVINDAQKSIDESKAEVEQGKIALEEGEAELRRNELLFNLEIEKAEAEIKKAYQELEALPEAQWILLDRTSHYSTYMFKNNAAQMGALGISLPVLFYLVAALVCMTTMTRLVDEQRGQIGVLRALGFSKFQITFKYVFYALLAALIGSGLGILFGMGLFPTVIYKTWRLMYDLPEMVFHFPIRNVIICVVSFALVMALVTALVTARNLKEEPSQLMRPKAPKNAKRIFLERIHALWWRLSFTGKITARNLIRYKSRFIMTVIGVAGCTGLLIVGWGIKDSISDVVAIQYGQIFNYDHMVNLTEEADVDKFKEVISKDLDNEYVVPVLNYVSKVYIDKDEPTISVMVGDARELNEIFLLKSRPGKEEIKIKNSGVIVSEKFAKNNGIKAGDKITIESHYGVKGEVRVDEICEMYFQHYLFISKDSYESLFGEGGKANSIMVKNPGGASFKKDIEKMEGYESVVDFIPMIEQFNTMLEALDFIILVIILTAGALAFVVLVNLTQVNISERVREIATLKVLGFRKGEVNSYIFKEVFLLSIIGGLLGIPLGIVEHRFIMNVINMEMIMFGQNIKWLSFVYAFGLTLVFTIIVLFFTRRTLRKVAMVESLKSVE